MTLETALLTLIAVLTTVIGIAVIAMAVALVRLAAGFREVEKKVDDSLTKLEREVSPTLKEIRGTARSLNHLSDSGRKLVDELVMGYASRRAWGQAPSPTGGTLTWVQGGLDLAVRAFDLWRNIRPAPRRSGHGGKDQAE